MEKTNIEVKKKNVLDKLDLIQQCIDKKEFGLANEFLRWLSFYHKTFLIESRENYEFFVSKYNNLKNKAYEDNHMKIADGYRKILCAVYGSYIDSTIERELYFERETNKAKQYKKKAIKESIKAQRRIGNRTRYGDIVSLEKDSFWIEVIGIDGIPSGKYLKVSNNALKYIL